MVIQAVVLLAIKKMYANILFAIFGHAYIHTYTTTNAMALKFLPTLSSDYKDSLLKDF